MTLYQQSEKNGRLVNALIKSRFIVSSVCLFLTFTFSDVYAQREDRFHEDKNHKIGKLWVHVTNFGQLGTNSGRGAVWPGTDIPGQEIQYINRGGWFFGGIVPSDDTQGRDLNDPGDLDTLVAEGFTANNVADFREMFPHFPDERSAIEVRSTVLNSEFFPQSAISGEKFVAAYTDTFLNTAFYRFVPLKHQRALGIAVIEKSYQFSETFVEDIVFFDLVIRNVGKNHIRNFYAGLMIFAAVVRYGTPNISAHDDATGYLLANSSGEPVHTAWIAQPDGSNGFVPGAVGLRILRPTSLTAKISYNWWFSTSIVNSKEDWGPVTPDVYTGAPNVNDPIGTPVDDPEKYIVMSNGSIDYDQFDLGNREFSPNIPSNNHGHLMVFLSAGPLGLRDSTISNPDDKMFGQTVKIFAPGDSIEFTLAIFGGEGDPEIARELKSFDPGALVDLSRNSIIANSVFDTPGVDTDGDGFAGLDLDGDGVFDLGDGVPDFAAPQPPPSPPLQITTGDRLVKLDWSAADPTSPGYNSSDPSLPLNVINPFLQDNPNTEEDERKNFEGFRVLRSRTGKPGTFELLAEFDLAQNEFGRNTGLSFTFEDHASNGSLLYYSVVSFDRGDPGINLIPLASSPLDNLTRLVVSPRSLDRFSGEIWVEPNPYIASAGFDNISSRSTGSRSSIDFVNVPSKCTIRILTIDGDLVHTLVHDDPNFSRVRWDLFNRDGRPIASGIYIFSVEIPNGDRREGRFIVMK